MVVEVLIIAIVWAIQIAAVLIIAGAIAVPAKILEEMLRKRPVKLLPRLLIAFVLLCAILVALAVNPIVICPEEFADDLTDDLRECVRNGAAGFYSWRIPLVPLCVVVTEIENCSIDGGRERKVEYSVYYFCVGEQKMEYHTYDGYNVAYPMFGLQ